MKADVKKLHKHRLQHSLSKDISLHIDFEALLKKRSFRSSLPKHSKVEAQA